MYMDPASQAFGLDVIAFRLLCALLIGGVIGIERETAHRPAGMRTHILVSLGACAVMITSQLLFAEYSALGANTDPARLSAQVIAGVGFLGAGTIIREGATVKGLTTAASIWMVACLGIAVGAGYLYVGLLGAGCMLVTLICFEWIQKKLIRQRDGSCNYTVRCEDLTAGLNAVNRIADAHHVRIRAIQASGEDGKYEISFHGAFHGAHAERQLQKFFTELSSEDCILRARSECTEV